MLTSVLTFIGTTTLPLYFVGHFLFAALILHTPNVLPRRLFGLTFSASGALLLLVLLEVWGNLEADSRWALWRLHLVGDLLLVVLLLPYVLLVLTVRRLTGLSAKIARWLALAPLAAWLWLFYKIGEPFPVMSGTSTWDHRELDSRLAALVALCLSRAGVLGVIVSALMSGIGAVHGPATSLRRLVQAVDPSILDEAKRGILSGLSLCAKQRLRLRAFARRQSTLRRRDALQTKLTNRAWRDERCFHEGSIFLSAAIASAKQALPLLVRSAAYREAASELRVAQTEDRHQRARLRRQLIALEQIVDDQQRAAFAQSRRGRFFNVLGYFFSAYCVYKVSMATRSILLNSRAFVQGGAASAVSSGSLSGGATEIVGAAATVAAGAAANAASELDGVVDSNSEELMSGITGVVGDGALSWRELTEYWQTSGRAGHAFVTRALWIAMRLSLLEEGVLAFWSQARAQLLVVVNPCAAAHRKPPHIASRRSTQHTPRAHQMCRLILHDCLTLAPLPDSGPSLTGNLSHHDRRNDLLLRPLVPGAG